MKNKSTGKRLLWLLVFAFIVLPVGVGLYIANYYNLFHEGLILPKILTLQQYTAG